MDNVTFQTNNVNFLREFWSTVVTYDPFSSTDETEQRTLSGLDYNNDKYVAHPTPEAVKKELGKFAINPSYLDKTSVLKNSFPMAWRIMFTFLFRFISCALQVLLGSDYTQDEKFGFLPGILSNSNFTKDPSKVTDIKMKAHIIAVNNQKDSMSLLLLAAKPKKGKSLTVTPTLPKSQGLEVSRALSKKSKRPKSKKPPTKTKVTPPKPMDTGLPSTLNEGTRKSKPLPESIATPPKDSGGNIQPLDKDITSTNSDEGTAKTTSHPEGSLGDKDSGENIPPADMELIHPLLLISQELVLSKEIDEEPQASAIAKTYHQSPPPQADKPQSSHALSTKASDTNSYSDDIFKKYDNILPLTKRQLVKYLRKMSDELFTRIFEDNWKKHEEATVNYVDLKASIDDYYDEKLLIEIRLTSWEIISKKKNAVVHDLMNSLSRRYKRIRTILEELGIKSTLPAPAPAPAPEQASSQSLRKKRKHTELEPETKIPGLECNRTLPENVLFVNNMVIEEPEHGIFFTDEFCDQAFQRWSDLDKVGMEVLVSYLVDAFMVKSPENARFSLKLKKLIAEHPDQKKLKSKKVKLEALGYEMN
nr:copia protein [Tanacetum cinerariifolium]